MEQAALTKSEKNLYSFLNILVKYLKKSFVDAADDLLWIIQESFDHKSEVALEIQGADDLAQVVKILVSKYPQLRGKEFQKELSEEIEGEGMASCLRDAVVEAVADNFPEYYGVANHLVDDDREYAYCSFSFAKSHTFHKRNGEKITTKVFNMYQLDFYIGKDFFSYDEPDAYSTQDYIWIIDAIPSMKMHEIKYGYGD